MRSHKSHPPKMMSPTGQDLSNHSRCKRPKFAEQKQNADADQDDRADRFASFAFDQIRRARARPAAGLGRAVGFNGHVKIKAAESDSKNAS